MLAAMKLGLVLIPAMPQLGAADIADRLERGRAKFLVAHGRRRREFRRGRSRRSLRIAVGDAPDGLARLRLAAQPQRALPARRADARRRPDAALFHLGHDGAAEARRPQPRELSDRPSVDHVRARPEARRRPSQHLLARLGEARLVERVRALERRSDHGRARQAFEPRATLDVLVAHGVTTFCAPPTVWRMLIQETSRPGTGQAAGDHFGRRAAQSGGDRSGPARLGPHAARFLRADRDDDDGRQFAGPEGDRRLDGPRRCRATASCCSTPTGSRATRAKSRCRSSPAPPGSCAATRTTRAALRRVEGDYYRTGDVASRDAEGYITYVGRADDVFKSSDYRLSPFELESALMEHEAVMEAAVVPAPDPVRFTTPKPIIVLAAGFAPDAETAASIFAHVRERLSPYKRVRRIEFCELPKTAVRKDPPGRVARPRDRPRRQGRACAGRVSESRIFRRGEATAARRPTGVQAPANSRARVDSRRRCQRLGRRNPQLRSRQAAAPFAAFPSIRGGDAAIQAPPQALEAAARSWRPSRRGPSPWLRKRAFPEACGALRFPPLRRRARDGGRVRETIPTPRTRLTGSASSMRRTRRSPEAAAGRYCG